MLKKGFIKNQVTEKNTHQKFTGILSSVLLYLGLAILVFSFAYLIFNFEKSETLIGILVPFLVGGLGLVLVSQLISRGNRRLRK